MDELSAIPASPHYAVIFTSLRTGGDRGYAEMADEMLELARRQPGFLGVESVRDASGFGITVSYWESEEAIRNWRENARHRLAQRLGRELWYRSYAVRVCKVERGYTFGE
ncbi:MAG: antibiotic biosynthesis monooxygenase [Chloroflexi bacterium]|nr:antibiotic biosynthesis monooxygenase [Chloroflexota bacterium]